MHFAAEKALRLRAGPLVQAVIDVHGEVRFLGGGKGVAMKADAACGGQFGLDVIAGEPGRVVAGVVDLFGSWRLDVSDVECSGNRGDEDVAIFARGSA